MTNSLPQNKVQKRLPKDVVSYLMLSPFLLFYVMSILIPLVVVFLMSFTEYNMFQSPIFVGVSNYTNIFINDSIFITALTNTIYFAVITGPVSFVICFFIAWIINEFTPKLRAFITLIFYIPSISGTAYIIWMLIFNPDYYGIANSVLIRLQIIKDPLVWFQDPSMSLNLLILVQLWLSLGIGFLSFIAGLQNVDSELYESGAIDGIKNRWQELWYITLPAMKNMLIFAGLIQITAAFSVGDISMTLTGFPSIQYSAHTLSIHAYDYGLIRYEMGYASAVSVILFVMILFSYKLFNLLIRKMGE